MSLDCLPNFARALRFLCIRASAVALLFAGAPAWSQEQQLEPTPIAPVRLSLFEGFPIPDGRMASPALTWPQRFGATSSSGVQGACLVVKRPHPKPIIRQVSWPIAPASREESPFVESLAAWAGHSGPLVGEFEGQSACVVSIERMDLIDDEKSKSYAAAMTFHFISGRPLQTREGEGVVRISRTLFSLLDATGDRKANPKGVVVFMPGLLGTPVGTVDQTIKMLRSDGWAVLRMWAQPSIFTQVEDVVLRGSEPLEPQAQRVAQMLGDRLAECAYSVEAALDQVKQARPELATLPRVAVGFSGGALTMPTVVARDPQGYAACVMIGGGADAFLLTLKTAYAAVGGPQYSFENVDDKAKFIQEFDAAYLANAPLDPFHCAPVLAGKPMLVIHANSDLAVPSPLGEVMWERLGKPERIIRDVGHEALFFVLPQEFPAIKALLNKAIQPAP